MSGLIVHEWAESAGGAEKVVDRFLELFSESELLCLWNDAPDRFKNTTVYETWMARTPFRKNKALALPLMIPTWRSVRLRKTYEWMLVSSHLFAHHIHLRNNEVPKFVYSHTPARYLWEPDLDARGNSRLVRIAAQALQPIDRNAAAQATSIATNSRFTQERVWRAWNRNAEVIYPPVEIEEIQAQPDWAEALSTPAERDNLETLPAAFVLGASRFVPYKRLERAIQVGEASGLEVVLAGAGPDLRRLQAIAANAKVPVRFVERPSDEMLRSLMQRATIYVFGAVEDFGIMPVEAMALGTPVLVPDIGGAAESVELVGGGIALSSFSSTEIREGLDRALRLERATFQVATNIFSAERFDREIATWIETQLRGSLHG